MDTKLSDHFEVKINDENREIFMSFALLNRLMFLIGDPDNIGLVSVNTDLREAIMHELLQKRSKSGKITEAVEVEDCYITLDDAQSLLDWATEHCMVFTLRALEKSIQLQERNKDKLSALATSLVGRLNSQLKTPVASPSEPSPQDSETSTGK